MSGNTSRRRALDAESERRRAARELEADLPHALCAKMPAAATSLHESALQKAATAASRAAAIRMCVPR